MKLHRKINPNNLKFAEQYILPLLPKADPKDKLIWEFHDMLVDSQVKKISPSALVDMINLCVHALPWYLLQREDNDLYSRIKKWNVPIEDEYGPLGTNVSFYQKMTKKQVALRKIPEPYLIILYIFVVYNSESYSWKNIELAIQEIRTFLSESIMVDPNTITILR